MIPIARDLAPFLRAAMDSSASTFVFPGAKGKMHRREVDINERIRAALKRAALGIGFDHKCRRCEFVDRRQAR